MPKIKDLKAIAKEYDIPLSKIEIMWLLGKGKNGFPLENRKWKQQCQEVEKKYKEVRLHRIVSVRIGEYLSRFLIALEDSRENAKQGILDVIILEDWLQVNKRLAELMGREMYALNRCNAIFFIYYLQKTKLEIKRDEQYWYQYDVKTARRLVKATETADLFQLNDKEKAEGRKKVAKLGVESEYICVHSRDDAYIKTINAKRDYFYHHYRDSDIYNIKSTAEYFDKKKIQMVRMGRVVLNKLKLKNCIDYASSHYDELLDIVLFKGCKFFLGDNSGIAILPMIMNKPLALKNVVPLFEAYAIYLPHNDSNLFIFKKYYSKKLNRFLSIREMKEIDKTANNDGRNYEKLGISVIENSEEEILDLAIEMNARLDGTWIENESDRELQAKYRKIRNDWIQEDNINSNAVQHYNVGTEFLKKNAFLLEDNENIGSSNEM